MPRAPLPIDSSLQIVLVVNPPPLSYPNIMAKRKKPTRQLHLNKQQVKERIAQFFNEGDPRGREADYRSIAAYIGVRDARGHRLIGQALNEMAESGLLRQIAHGRFTLAVPRNVAQGIITIARGGSGSITLEGGAEVAIPSYKTGHALNGDTVEVHYSFSRRLKGLQGEVTRIVKRARTSFVGIIQVERGFAFLVPDSRYMPYDLYIPLEELHGAQHGQKAIAQITQWPDEAKNPYATVTEVLGMPGKHEVEMHAILAEFGLPYVYPEEVTAAAEKLSDAISKDEIAKRRDCRALTTFTIDPATAKDFDDALSYRTLDNGHVEVAVHIADVTHYVTPDSIIDEEAFQRGTSVYLVDRTVPMLPERLCNNICSLRPNEDKLTYSVIFQLDEQANVVDFWIGRTIIRSDARLTYEQAQQVIEGGDSPYATEIRGLHALATILRNRRFADGAIDFATREVRFKLDKDGHPIGVYPVEDNESHHLIEEFMLLANRTVAQYIGKPKPGKPPRPFVYRVHDRPDPQKLDTFCHVIATFGHQYKGDTTTMSGQDITRVIKAVRGRPEEHLIDILAVRSMAKAIYTTKNIGHFGLAFPYYTHFTSPIRRYPDMMVHRLLTLALDNQPFPSQDALEEKCRHASEMERVASEAERASIKYKQVEYLKDRLGDTFEGTISGVADFGMFVELNENSCEGMVSMRDMTDDFYVFNPDDYTIVGRSYGHIYRLGDPVKIRVLRADLTLKHIDFEILEHMGNALAQRERPSSTKRLNQSRRKPTTASHKRKGRRGRH